MVKITDNDNVLKKPPQNPHSPWENSTDPSIGKIRSMVRNFMRAFDIPLKGHYWAHKWCVDVHNIAYYININGRFLLEISEEHTKDI